MKEKSLPRSTAKDAEGLIGNGNESPMARFQLLAKSLLRVSRAQIDAEQKKYDEGRDNSKARF